MYTVSLAHKTIYEFCDGIPLPPYEAPHKLPVVSTDGVRC